MKFSEELTPLIIPCLVFDRWGIEINQVVSGNTTTGLCRIAVLGDNGTPHETNDKRPVIALATFAAPLSIVVGTPEAIKALEKYLQEQKP
jgi:hypothetical protein